MNRAIVVGSINMDVVARVERHPKIGETIIGDSLEYFPGGKGANQAVACRRLGAPTKMIGRVGSDSFGQELIEFLRNETIDITHVTIEEKQRTGIALIGVSAASDNTIIVVPSANGCWSHFSESDLPCSEGDLVICQFEIPDRVIAASFRAAKQHGATTILNPAPVRLVSNEIRDLVDILVVNEHELSQLSKFPVDIKEPQSIRRAALGLIEIGFKTIIVTLGKDGVRLFDKQRDVVISGRVVDAVDTTGAGDTFIGALAAGIIRGLSLEEASEYANIAASISVTRHGAAPSIPWKKEVDDLLCHLPGSLGENSCS